MKKYLFIYFSLFFIFCSGLLNAGVNNYELTIGVTAVNEDIGSASLTIRIDPKINDNNENITVDFTTTNETAEAGSDYTATTNSVTLRKNDTGADITIPITNDSVSEDQETFIVTISNPVLHQPATEGNEVTIVTPLGRVTINDDDSIGGTPAISVTGVTVDEGAGTASFTITRTEQATSTVSFTYATGDLTATVGQDYTLTTDTGSISPGESITTIKVPIIDDSIAGEGDETFSFVISNPSVGTDLGNGIATGTIQDNDENLSLAINDASIAEGDSDTLATVKILFSKALTEDVNLTYETKDGNSTTPTIENAIAGDDYVAIVPTTVTIPSGTTEFDLDVTIKGDTVGESAEEFNILITNVSSIAPIVVADDISKITIFDNDNNGGCSSYTGLMTINEYQNNPNYKDSLHPLANQAGMVPGNYVEIKYIDFLIKQYVNDLWKVSIYTTAGAASLTWNQKDPECTDPRYEIFEMDNKVMGAQGYVVLTDANGNEVDVLNIDNSDHYTPGCIDFPYDTTFESSAQNKDLFRIPDGTGDWFDNGSGANSGGSRCINRDGTGVLFTEFDAIDILDKFGTAAQPIPTAFTGSIIQTPIKTKIVNKEFDLKILWLDLGAIPVVLKTDGTLKMNVYLGYDNNGVPEKLAGENPAKLIEFTEDADGQVLVSASNTPAFIYGSAVKEAKVLFEYCSDENLTIYSLETCADTVNYSYSVSLSRNTFAIRPEKLVVGLSDNNYPNLLRAGEEYSISLTATDPINTHTDAYTVTGNYNNSLETNTTRYFRDNVKDLNDKLKGAYDINTSLPSYMINGFSSTTTTEPASAQEVIRISYSDVGKAELQIYDYTWAEIDNDDTFTDCNDNHPHTSICGELNATFIPHHFGFEELNITNHAGPVNNDFTYIADSRGMPIVSANPVRGPMAARIQTRIEALTKNNTIAENFREDDGSDLYYENPISVTPVVEVPTIASGKLNAYLYPDANESNITNQLVGFGRTGIEKDDNGTRNIKWDESTYPLEFNFQREINQPANPFDVNGSYVSITLHSIYTDASTPSSPQDINGSRVGDFDTTAWTACASDDGCEQRNADNNATFYYGRARSSKYFYEDITESSVFTPNSVVIYCDPYAVICDDYNVDTAGGEIDEPNWYLSTSHRASIGDGNITLKVNTPLIEGSGSPTINTKANPNSTNITIESNGVENNVTVATGNNPTLPMTVPLVLVRDGDILTTTPPYTNEWLIYNEFDNTLTPNPFYKVRFIDQASWTGEGQTGHVMDTEASYKKSQRVDW